MENDEAVQTIIKKLNAAPTDHGKLYLSKARPRNEVPISLRTGGQGSQKEKSRITPNNTSSPAKVKVTKGPTTRLTTATPLNCTSVQKETAQQEASTRVSSHDGGKLKRASNTGSGTKNADISLKPSDDMLRVIKTSLFVRTAKNETIDTVTMIAEGLGVRNVQIRGISGTTFIAYFANKLDLDHVDIDFLQIGFMEVREVKIDDLLPCRKTWVEVRGLPIMGWNEDNYKSILRDYGNVLQFSTIYDTEGFYQHPKFLIETGYIEEISAQKSITLMGRNWKVRILEVSGSDIILNDISSHCDGELTPVIALVHIQRHWMMGQVSTIIHQHMRLTTTSPTLAM